MFHGYCSLLSVDEFELNHRCTWRCVTLTVTLDGIHSCFYSVAW